MLQSKEQGAKTMANPLTPQSQGAKLGMSFLSKSEGPRTPETREPEAGPWGTK